VGSARIGGDRLACPRDVASPHRGEGPHRQRQLLPLPLFDAALPDGARHTFTRPHHPQANGKVERYNRTLGAEFAYARPWTSETQRADYLSRWLIHDNYHRAHTARVSPPEWCRSGA